jgi:hypothetical protein
MTANLVPESRSSLSSRNTTKFYRETRCLLDDATIKVSEGQIVNIYINISVLNYSKHCFNCSGPDSSAGIVTNYGLDGPGIKSRCGRNFPPVQTGPRAHPASCTMGTGSFPRVKCGRGVLLTTHPLLAPRSWKNRAIHLLPSGPQPAL